MVRVSLWDEAVAEIMQPPEPEYKHGDPVYIDQGEYDWVITKSNVDHSIVFEWRLKEPSHE